jgi:hypothetical protein
MTGEINLQSIVKYIHDRAYMSGIARDRLRIKHTSEIFTPTDLVRKLLNDFPNDIFANATETFLDSSCGDGQFLGEILIRKIENGIDFEIALSTIYGVDIMQDNVDLCRERLLCGQEHLRHIVEKNIVCADSLRYHYRFDGTDPYKTDQDIKFDNLFQTLD